MLLITANNEQCVLIMFVQSVKMALTHFASYARNNLTNIFNSLTSVTKIKNF